jgi:hypothetical protein
VGNNNNNNNNNFLQIPHFLFLEPSAFQGMPFGTEPNRDSRDYGNVSISAE